MTGSEDNSPPPSADAWADEMGSNAPHNPEERRQKGLVGELLRRAVENAVESVQSTGTVSKDALQFVLQQGDRGKKELVRIIAKEVGDFMRGVDLSGELAKVLTSVGIEVKASIRFVPAQDGTAPKPKIELKVETDESETQDTPPTRPGP